MPENLTSEQLASIDANERERDRLISQAMKTAPDWNTTAFVRGQMDRAAGIVECPFAQHDDAERCRLWRRGWMDANKSLTREVAEAHAAQEARGLDGLIDDISDTAEPMVEHKPDPGAVLVIRGSGHDAEPVRANEGDIVGKLLICVAAALLIALGVQVFG